MRTRISVCVLAMAVLSALAGSATASNVEDLRARFKEIDANGDRALQFSEIRTARARMFGSAGCRLVSNWISPRGSSKETFGKASISGSSSVDPASLAASAQSQRVPYGVCDSEVGVAWSDPYSASSLSR